MSCSARASLLALLLASSPAAAQQPEDAPVFEKCRSCHSLQPDDRESPGPSLAGVVGRKVAGLPEFRYSPALREAGEGGLVWSRDALNRYLADPQEAVPGGWMGFPGIRDAEERRAVVDFLARY